MDAEPIYHIAAWDKRPYIIRQVYSGTISELRDKYHSACWFKCLIDHLPPGNLPDCEVIQVKYHGWAIVEDDGDRDRSRHRAARMAHRAIMEDGDVPSSIKDDILDGLY
jgi:hypothetical protein